MPAATIGRTTAIGEGVAIRSELRVRLVPTEDGEKVVKLAANGEDEGPFSLANELLGSGLAVLLGLFQPRRWVVEIPARLAEATGWSARLRHHLGAGTDLDEAFRTELDNEPVIAGARTAASGESVLAGLVVLDWLRLGDHEGHNFVQKDRAIIPVDFASAPAESVWRDGVPQDPLSADPGGLRAELHRVTEKESAAIRAQFDAIGEPELQGIVAEIPTEMTEGLGRNVVKVLLETKEEVRRAYWP